MEKIDKLEENINSIDWEAIERRTREKRKSNTEIKSGTDRDSVGLAMIHNYLKEVRKG